jgi:predicted RNase H-like HicB family nuclease
MVNYSFNLIWSKDDNGYIATIPEFPNLSAFGTTQEEALQEAQYALEGYIEEIQNNKDPLPDPICLSKFSGHR